MLVGSASSHAKAIMALILAFETCGYLDASPNDHRAACTPTDDTDGGCRFSTSGHAKECKIDENSAKIDQSIYKSLGVVPHHKVCMSMTINSSRSRVWDLLNTPGNMVWHPFVKRSKAIGGTEAAFESPPSVKNKRKKKKKKGKKSSSRNRGFSGNLAQKQAKVVEAESTPATASMQQRQHQEEKEEEAEGKKVGIVDGLLGSVKDSMQQANAMARVQALEINSALEDRGVLPRLNQTSTEEQEEE
mmetsp:Transcript_21959/g.30761  ORF Transcript_21959/g.30761 Transcript_21959/m.30761 type:complete len:246 (-) Transcript_21959:197-934(-)